jgi:two-component system response regulator DevR
MQALTNYEKRGSAGPNMPMKRIRVLIVDEHVAVRRALASRLSSSTHIDVIATAQNFNEGLEHAHALHPDVILLELKGTDSLGPDPVGEMSRVLTDHPTGIIVLTTYAEDDEREAALKAGARRYLLKHIDTTSLLAEIEAVVAEVTGESG